MKTALFIMRRDLRLYDNIAFIKAAAQGAVLPCFIFDPRQYTEQNQFFSNNSFEFMLESLQAVSREIQAQGGKFYCFLGRAEEVIASLCKQLSLSAVYVNRDYTPFSRMRDSLITEVCERAGVPFMSCEDALLNAPGSVLTSQGSFYTVFTPFYKNSIKHEVAKPANAASVTWYTGEVSLKHINIDQELTPEGEIYIALNRQRIIQGGRTEGLKILKLLEDFSDYAKTRDIPAVDTTHLSAHLKFGTLSVREVYHAIARVLGQDHALMRQLYWRDFYTHIVYAYPHVFGAAFKQEFDAIAWSYDQTLFERWCYGMTGFPLVDAGMRELRETGFMHNRVRMVTGSFLVKDLRLDWRLGERYFARLLVDYDPAVNNGNWQWVASTGCDPQPYFRIFNPWLQQKKFDPECVYIKKWIPELRDLSPREIHDRMKAQASYNGYPMPIVDHTAQARKAIALFKAAHRQNID